MKDKCDEINNKKNSIIICKCGNKIEKTHHSHLICDKCKRVYYYSHYNDSFITDKTVNLTTNEIDILLNAIQYYFIKLSTDETTSSSYKSSKAERCNNLLEKLLKY